MQKSPTGYMWFGTMSGISRYDGNEIVNYTVDDSLCNNRVRSLAYKGTDLLVGTENGLSVMSKGRFRNYSLEAFGSSKINKILVVGEQTLLLTDRGILEFTDDLVKPLPLSSGIDSTAMMDGVVGSNGRIWVAAGPQGLIRLENQHGSWAFSKISIPEEIYFVRCVYEDTKGNTWVGTSGTGAYKISANSIDHINMPSSLRADNITVIHEDVQGNMLLGSWTKGLIKYNGISFEQINTTGGLKGNQVLSLYADEEGLIWIGTFSDGVQLLRGTEFVFYSQSHGLPDRGVRGITKDLSGDIWGTTLNGLFRVVSGRVDSVLRVAECSNRFGPIVTMSTGTLLAGTYGGELVSVSTDKKVRLIKDPQLLGTEIMSLCTNTVGDEVYIGTLGSGVYKWDGTVATRLDTLEDLDSKQIWAILEVNKVLYLGTNSGVVAIASDGTTTYPGSHKAQVRNSRVTSITRQGDYLFFTTDSHGLWRLSLSTDKVEHLQTDENLSSNQIFSSVWLDSINLMLTNHSGIDRIRFFPDHHLVDYYQVDFGENLQFNINAVLKGPKGTIWIGCNQGLLLYDPSKAINFLKPPDLHVNDVLCMQQELDWQEFGATMDENYVPRGFTLPYNKNYLTFSFRGIQFRRSESIRYQYRLLGQDTLWSPLSASNDAIFPNLPYGEYRFQVRATTNGGKAYSRIQEIPFTISAPYYKTWWFFAIVALGICLVIYIFSLTFKKVQSQVLQYSTLQQSLGTNRLMLLFMGLAYPLGAVSNSLAANVEHPQITIAVIIGLIGLISYAVSFSSGNLRTRLSLIVLTLFLLIEGHIMVLIFANSLHVTYVIGLVMVTAFASVVFNTVRNYFIFAAVLFVCIVTMAAAIPQPLFSPLQFALVGFWALVIVSLLLIVKLNLFRKLRLSDTILEKGDSIILVRNDKGAIIYASGSVEEKLGYPLDEVYGDGWWKIREKNDDIKREEIIGNIDRAGGSIVYTNEIHDIHGQKKYFNWSDTRIEGGLVIGVGQDVTSLRESQMELEKLSIIASKTDSGVLLLDTDDRVEWMNESFAEMMGYTFDELKGKKPGDLLSGEASDVDKIHRSRQDKYKRKTYQMEVLAYKKSGTPIWLSINHTPIFKEGTEELQWQVNVVNDITKAKDRREEMKRLSLVATKTDNYVIISDGSDTVMWVNDAFEKIFKYKAKDVIGTKTSSFFRTEEFNPRQVKKLRKDVLERKVPFVGELTDVDAEGNHLWLAVNITPILDADGEIEQIISLGSDITDKKLDEFQLNEYSKSLELMHEIDNVLLEQKNEQELFHEMLRVVVNSNSLFTKVSLMIISEDFTTLEDYRLDEGEDEMVYTEGIQMESLRSKDSLKKGESLIVQDLENDIRSESDRMLVESGVKSYVMMPLLIDQRVVGSLNVGGKFPFMFIDDEVKIIKDITNSLSVAYKQREQARKIVESEENFRQLNESLKEVFWLYDRVNEKMIYVSKACELIFGFPASEMMENPSAWMEVIVADDQARIQRDYFNSSATEGFDEQFQIKHPDQGIRWIHSTALPIRNGKGEVVKISGFAGDITELKRKEEELGFLNTKLESISSINESILRNEPFGSVLIESIKRMVSDQFDIKRVTLTMFDFPNNELSFFRIDNELRSVSNESEKLPISYFKNVDRLKVGETVIVENLTEEAELSESDKELLKSGTKSYILLPLISERELIGSLNLAFTTAGKFDPDFVKGLRDVANGISLSIHQMQLKSIIEGDKEALEIQNKDITASINYAKRIQQAYLPEIDFVKKFFSNACLYYKPKDIVSGDFYWWTLKNNKLILVVADCTGHGVPGGFMTILGSQTIANIVEGKSITDPGLLLKVLDLEIQYALNKAGEELRDGMDVAVCSIDLTSKEMIYAGARRPLVYVSEGQPFELKGTSRSIGEDELVAANYSTTKIQLRKGDRFFMFSDGIPDQFGGSATRPRKYSKKRLKELVEDEELNKASLEKQFQAVVDDLEKWQGDLEQTDDMIFLALEF